MRKETHGLRGRKTKDTGGCAVKLDTANALKLPADGALASSCPLFAARSGRRQRLGQNILRISGRLLVDNAATSSQSSPSGADPVQFALLCENMEKFYSACDQLETLLRLALAWHGHAADARKHLPFSVASLTTTATRLDTDAPPVQSATGADLSRVIQLQVAAARELHDLLVHWATRLD